MAHVLVGGTALCGLVSTSACVTDHGSPGEAAAADAGADASSVPIGFAVHGRAVDGHGTAWRSPSVSLCGTACIPGTSADDGSFAIVVPAGVYALDVRPPPGDLRSGVPVVSRVTVLGETRLDGPVVIPETGPVVALTQKTQVMIDHTLTIEIDPASLARPYGATTVGIAGVLVEPSQRPAYSLPAGRLLALWALNPFGASSKSPARVSLRNDYGLLPGERANLFSVSETTGDLQLESVVTTSADGAMLETAPGDGINNLTWVALASAH